MSTTLSASCSDSEKPHLPPKFLNNLRILSTFKVWAPSLNADEGGDAMLQGLEDDTEVPESQVQQLLDQIHVEVNLNAVLVDDVVEIVQAPAPV